jgi:Zn-dependent peptidase ImmA (M78 family)/transcriptional regulator with XRE-family HTH domain
MRVGTPGFSGSRLREGREARGFTAAALARELQVSPQSVSLYESGAASPSPDVAQRLCTVLDLPLAFFLRPPRTGREACLFFRSMASATRLARASATRRYGWVQDIVLYLSEFLDFPPVSFPDPSYPADPTRLSDADIEYAAGATRRFWRLGAGPISNVVFLLENNGAIVVRDQFGVETLDAFCESSSQGDQPIIFLGADKRSAVRSRMDAAHELGHIVLHRHVARERMRHTADLRLMETQAQRFAGAFLLPATSFGEEFVLPTLEVLQALKPKWLASIGLMLKRSEDLGLLAAETSRRLWASVARRGWKQKEPMDDMLPVEQPRLLRQSFDLLIQEGIQRPGDIRMRLALHPRDIEDLSGLPTGFLDDAPPTVSVIGRPRPTDNGPRGPAEITPIRRAE